MNRLVLATVTFFLAGAPGSSGDEHRGPYDAQVAENAARLRADSAKVRARAAEALGFLRAYSAEEALIERLRDESVEVRRQAAMALAWCGGRRAVAPLVEALDDDDWIARQAAHVSLTNLTGMEFPFDATAPPEDRALQANVWRDWWNAVPADRPPKQVLDLLAGAKNWPSGYSVTASSTYKGPPSVHHIL